MDIGILGSGDVGHALARGLAGKGHRIVVGTRDPLKLADLEKEMGGKVKAGSFKAAAEHGEIVILALNGEGAEAALEMAGPSTFAGKLVLDVTVPLDFSKGMPPGLFVGTTDSLGERIQRKLPQAKVVKCFNTVGNPQMVEPRFKEGTPPMLIAGDDADAKKRTEEFVRSIGWPGVVDTGGIDGARWLEALVPLWVRVGVAQGSFGHAFKAVR